MHTSELTARVDVSSSAKAPVIRESSGVSAAVATEVTPSKAPAATSGTAPVPMLRQRSNSTTVQQGGRRERKASLNVPIDVDAMRTVPSFSLKDRTSGRPAHLIAV